MSNRCILCSRVLVIMSSIVIVQAASSLRLLPSALVRLGLRSCGHLLKPRPPLSLAHGLILHALELEELLAAHL